MWECQPPFWTTYVLAFLTSLAFSLHIHLMRSIHAR